MTHNLFWGSEECTKFHEKSTHFAPCEKTCRAIFFCSGILLDAGEMRSFDFPERMWAVAYAREVIEPSKEPRSFVNTKLGNPGNVCLLCQIHVKFSRCLNSHKLDIKNVSDMSLNINNSSNAIISCSAVMKANWNCFFFKPAKSAECLARRNGPWIVYTAGYITSAFEPVSLIRSTEKPIQPYLLTNYLHLLL